MVRVKRRQLPVSPDAAPSEQRLVSGHPVVWAWLWLIVVTIALGTTNLIVLALLVLGQVVIGTRLGGPRAGSFTLATGIATASTVLWMGWTLAAPGSTAGPVLWTLPRLPGSPGVEFGGPVTTGALALGGVGALRAAVVILMVGLAGQVVSARGWLGLARTLLGDGATWVSGWCCAGEASAETVARAARDRRAGWPRWTPVIWFTTWLTAAVDLAATSPADPDRPEALSTPVRLLVIAVTVGGAVLALSAPTVGAVANTHLTGMDQLALLVLLLGIIGLLFPGRARVLGQWRASDGLDVIAAGFLTAAWALRTWTGEVTSLTPDAGSIPPVPWLVAGAVLLFPVLIAGPSLARGPRAAHTRPREVADA